MVVVAQEKSGTGKTSLSSACNLHIHLAWITRPSCQGLCLLPTDYVSSSGLRAGPGWCELHKLWHPLQKHMCFFDLQRWHKNLTQTQIYLKVRSRFNRAGEDRFQYFHLNYSQTPRWVSAFGAVPGLAAPSVETVRRISRNSTTGQGVGDLSMLK